MSLANDDAHRVLTALAYTFHGLSLLLRTPALVRLRSFLAALHVLPVGFACQILPSEHGVVVVTLYATAGLLLKAARSTPPSLQEPAPEGPDPTPT